MRSVSPPATAGHPRRWLILAVLVAAVLLLAVDGTVLYLAIPSLTEDLDPSAEQILWIGDIYSLALASLLVIMGTLADRIGRRKLLLIGATAFGLTSVIAAFSSSPEMLIAARLLLGVAGATIMPTTLAMLRNVFTDDQERTQAIAIWAAAAGGGAAVGPLIGGLLLEHFWWGSVFLINVPVMIVVLIAGVRILPESRDPSPGAFDVPSAVMSFVAVGALVYAIKHAASDGFDATFAFALVAGLVVGYLFGRRQARLEHPMLDLSLFKRPVFAGAVAADVLAIFALTGTLFFFSQYLQFARGQSPLEAGLTEMPAALAAIAVIGLVTQVVRRLGLGRSISLGLFAAALGLVVIGVGESTDSLVVLGVGLVLIGLGVGLAMTLSADAIVSAAPPRKAGAVSAISETAYELGIVLGIAILGSLLTAIYRSALELPANLTGAARAGVEDSFASALTVVGPGSPIAETAKHAFVDAMQTTSFIAAGILVVGALVALLVIPATKTAEPGDLAQNPDRTDPDGTPRR
jgi:DHA2 family multidrug resistance protein-like MFS transporter